MRFLKNIIKTSFIIALTLSFSNISNSSEKNYYKDLINDWLRIFPDKNRNAAGPKFFKYIIDKEITYKDFIEYNKLYCAVSGSLIDPNSQPDFIFVNERKTQNKICGNYYKCCIPCSCDIMKYSEVEKMKHKFLDGLKEFYVFTIRNPCNKNDFPNRVNKNYFYSAVFHSDAFSVQDSIAVGFIDEVVSQDKFMDRVMEKATELATLPHPFYANTKKSAQDDVRQKISGAIEKYEKLTNLK